MSKNIENQDDVTEKLMPYWKQQLAGLPPLLELPVRHPRVSSGSYEKAHLSFELSRHISDALKELSGHSGVTLFTTLLACFKTLLYRYTNQENIVIGCPIIQHNVSNTGELNSNLVNTLALRTDLSGDLSFTDLLTRVAEVVNDAGAHKELPFETLVDALKMEQGSVPASLFQIMFTFENGSPYETGINGLSQSRTGNVRWQQCDLNLVLEDVPEGLAGVWEYNANILGIDTITGIAEHYRILLEGILDNPEQKISLLHLLSADEYCQIISEWNNTGSDYPHDKCIHELFEQQVRLTPHAIAVKVFNATNSGAPRVKQELTYEELNVRANQLAHYLQSHGVGPEVLVGICVERSPGMVIGLLAILKAGGAYLPLDPSYPKERLSFMLQDAQVKFLVTQQRFVEGLGSFGAKTVCLDTDWHTIEKHSSANAASGVHSNNLAYVIYTSGSTGRPKGTLIIHQGVVNYLSWCIKEYALADGTGSPVNSSFAFDATVTSFFSPLLSGRQILLLPEEGEIEALCSALLSHNYFSLVKITPAHLQILAQLLPVDQVEGQTNALVIGGENLPSRSLDLWRTHAPGTRLINEYGPTETVVGCCIYEATGKSLLLEDVPIGRPIANTQMYILDRHLQPVPVGVAGEIYIGGAGLARGYINRPDLTAEKFIGNPFDDNINARLYKTGDAGRFQRDGTIIFLGRLDHQVKIRGYRIELGEIESTLSQHPNVKQAVVLAREDTPGDKRLVAYLVLNQADKPGSGDLRRFLKEKLPEYMIPAIFMFIEVLPLTNNGKIDRAALPVPDQQRTGLEKDFVAPRNKLEVKLTKIFEECLKIHPIGIHDNFFDLGAHSIQAAYIFSRIKKNLGKQLHLSILLEAPTIEQLATLIRRKDKPAPWSALVPIQPHGTRPPLYCIHGGIGTVLFYRDLANHLGTDQPFYGLQAKGLNGIGMPHTRIEDMATHYINEIQRIQPRGPYYLGGYCFGGIVAFEMAKQLTQQGHEIALLANFNAVSPTYVNPQEPVAETETAQEEEVVKTLSDRVSLMMQKTGNLSRTTRLLYLVKMLEKRLKHRMQFQMKIWIYKYCFKYGRPLPEALAKFYLWETNTDMVRAYRPQPYKGSLVIFRSPDIYQDPHLGWTGLIDGSIDTCDIPGEHENRRHILVEPFAPLLAAALKKYMRNQDSKK